MDAVEFTIQNKLSSETSVYQVEDGNLFYHVDKTTHLYVESQGQRYFGDIPDETIKNAGTYGNALVFRCHNQVYKATFTQSIGIQICCLRVSLPDEEWSGAAYSRVHRDGKRYAYRPTDDPNGPGIEVDEEEKRRSEDNYYKDITERKLFLLFIHRENAVYRRPDEYAVLIRENTIIFKAGPSLAIYSNESSARIYYLQGNNGPTMGRIQWLHIVNTVPYATRELSDMELKTVGADHIVAICGVHNGIITVTARADGELYLMTALLPKAERFSNLVSSSSFTNTDTKGRNKISRSLSADSTKPLSVVPWLRVTSASEKDTNGIITEHEELKSRYCDIFNQRAEAKRTLEDALETNEKLEKELTQLKDSNDKLLLKLRINESQQEFTSKFVHDFGIKSILGKGKFGIVFKVKNALDDSEYAVKRIAVEPRWNNVNKALGEVRAMAQLDHPGIIRYNSTWIEKPPEGWQHTVDEDIQSRFASPTIPAYNPSAMFIYIQMQLCNDNLEQWLSKSGATPRNLSVMKSWLMQIVTATEYIHNKGLIHRDLKPSNILFVKADHLKICDLGISTEFNLVDSCNGTGTPLYMAPEQGIWEFDSKVDIFSIGLIFAEMCIPMIGDKRKNIFNAIRKRNNVLRGENQAQETVEFIEWLTHSENFRRPTCTHILQSSFFAQESNYLK